LTSERSTERGALRLPTVTPNRLRIERGAVAAGAGLGAALTRAATLTQCRVARQQRPWPGAGRLSAVKLALSRSRRAAG
jgi:hypothetical protein